MQEDVYIPAGSRFGKIMKSAVKRRHLAPQSVGPEHLTLGVQLLKTKDAIDLGKIVTFVTVGRSTRVGMGAGEVEGQVKVIKLGPTSKKLLVASKHVAGTKLVTLMAGEIWAVVWDGELWQTLSAGDLAGPAVEEGEADDIAVVQEKAGQQKQ